MTLTQKLQNAGFWQMIQVLVQAITQFVYMAVMARLLSKSDFGLMALAASFIGIGAILSEAGMGSALIQRKNITYKHKNAAMQGNFIIGVIVFSLFFFLSKYIAFFFNQPKLEMIIKVVGVNVVFSSLNSVSRGLLQKNFKFKITSNITMITTIIGYGLGIILAFLNYGVWSLVAATLSVSLLSTIIMFFYAPVSLRFQFYYKEWRELFSFGFGLILSRLINYMNTSGVNLFVGKIFSPVQLGVFERTFSIKSIPSNYLGDVLDTIMFPAMSEIQDEENRLFQTYQYSLGVVNSLLMPVAVFLIFFSKEIVLILLGDKWLDSVLPLQIMFIVLPFSISVRLADSVVRSKGLIYKNVSRRFAYMLVLLSTISVGAYYYGIVGASISVVVSYLFHYVIMLILVASLFEKTIKEIFLEPIRAGLKLSLLILILMLFISFFLKPIVLNPILYFCVNSIFIVVILTLIAKIKPSIFGFYLQEVANKFLNRRR